MLHRCQLIATEKSLNLLVANTASVDRHGNCQQSGKAVIESCSGARTKGQFTSAWPVDILIVGGSGQLIRTPPYWSPAHPPHFLGCAYFYSSTEMVGMMKTKKPQDTSRRKYIGLPKFPLKDSNGATIRICRRKCQDRRIDRVRAERINEAMFSDCL